MRKNPGFAITAILTLALGIGVNASIFQLMDAVRLRSLPVADPDRLASVEIQGGVNNFIPVRPTDLSYPLWEQVRDHQEGFSSVFAWRTNHVRIGEGVEERKAVALWLTGEAFNTLGIFPAKGRFLSPEEDKPNCGIPGTVISYAFWQSQFGGQDSAIGSTILIERKPTRVLGVMPPRFFGLEVGHTFDFALPLCSTPSYHDDLPYFTRPDYFFLTVMGRLKFDWTLARASAQLESISPGIIAATVPIGYSNSALDVYRRYQLSAYPAGHGIQSLRAYDSSLWLLFGITTLVLLIACANLANLMLVRGNSRQREIAVRLAIGASRWRLIRQSLAEGLILATSGATFGMLLAAVFSRAIVWFISSTRETVQLDLGIDWRIFVFTGALALLTCVIFDLWPAIRSSQTSPGIALKSGSRGTTQGRERFSFQQTLVVAQIAVSMVLLVGALLFVRSFRNLVTYNPGFREEGIVLGYFNLGHRKLNDLESYDRAVRDLLSQIRTNPGVDSAASTTHVPLNGSTWQLVVHGAESEGPSKFTWISPAYFETMHIPLLAGRLFSDELDTRTSPHVMIVNEVFARTFFGQDNPVGKTVRTIAEPGYPGLEFQIVGVVKDTKYGSLRDPVPPESYAPSAQFPPGQKAVFVFVHTSMPPDRVIPILRASVQEHDPEMDYELFVYQNTVEETLKQERMMAFLSGSFGALAALLTMVGLYGVISYITMMRRNEIGIRMALGADRSSVLRLISRQTMQMLGVGVLLGVLISLAATRGASSLLFGLHPNDPLSILYAAGLLIVVALLAGFIPARRASLINPSNALRDE
ncbi:MAG: ABC transporter permease [Acidobacteria bacterium]|nr:ABC transporter permease [Acidobacteriota bacterium]